jgi:hypothetical protein
MTRRRRPIYEGVSNRAIKLFWIGAKLEHDGKIESELFKKIDAELSRELGLKPWHPSVFELDLETDSSTFVIPDYVRPDHIAYWLKVGELKRQLVAAPLDQSDDRRRRSR